MGLNMSTTIGDLFPEMSRAAPAVRQKKLSNKTTRTGTAERLKTLYPEIDSWHPVLVTKAWLHWCKQNQQDSREPSKRDERFPDYIIHLLLENMRDEDSAKRRKRPSMSLSERLDRLFAGEGQENAECH